MDACALCSPQSNLCASSFGRPGWGPLPCRGTRAKQRDWPHLLARGRSNRTEGVTADWPARCPFPQSVPQLLTVFQGPALPGSSPPTRRHGCLRLLSPEEGEQQRGEFLPSSSTSSARVHSGAARRLLSPAQRGFILKQRLRKGELRAAQAGYSHRCAFWAGEPPAAFISTGKLRAGGVSLPFFRVPSATSAPGRPGVV